MLDQLLDDLEAEQATLDAVVTGFAEGDLARPTPAEGWTVRDQLSHLAFSEELAGLAVNDAARFGARLGDLLADLQRAESEPRDRAQSMTAAELLAWWQDARGETVAGLRARSDQDRIPWVTGEMSAVSFATARLMETWAHGQDVVDAVGAERTPTARLRHVAHIGFATRGFSYQLNGIPMPTDPVRVELKGPDGDTWSWGPEDAAARVTGGAEDFCLVVTQRRHVTDTDLRVEGRVAGEWMLIAQAFAGPPGTGRAPTRGTR